MLTEKIQQAFSPVAHYLKEYQREENHLFGNDISAIQQLRQNALKQFAKIGFPKSRQADWKYTSLASFLCTPFSSITQPVNRALKEDLEKIIPKTNAYRLVFINGLYSPHLSQISSLPESAAICNIKKAVNTHGEVLIKHLQNLAQQQKNNSFMQLNHALMQDGAFIYLPANSQLKLPIELVFVNNNELQFIPLCNVIVADENSQATIIEKHITFPKAQLNNYFVNSLTSCHLAAESQLNHYKLIEESMNSTHIGHLCVTQQQNSQCSAHSITLSGGLVRNDKTIHLEQPQAHCQLFGLYTAAYSQQVDHQTIVEHHSPNTTSKQLYKGIIDGAARAVFNGKIIMRPGAIKSKAQQLNKNLLLSSKAEVNTKPQLEIFVDDIQCQHGASIGQLDESALFYLRARGINEANARALLIQAFIQDVLEQMPLATHHTLFQPALNQLIVNDYAQL